MYSVFDYDSRWAEVIPVLDHPLVQHALNAGMKEFLEQDRVSRMEYCKFHHMDTSRLEPGSAGFTWNPEYGPWSYSIGNSWFFEASDKLDASPEWQAYWKEHHSEEDDVDPTEEDDRVREEMLSRFLPQPNTPNWFRCYSACHSLCGWNCAVGSLLMPDRDWYTLGTTRHSNAIGIGHADAVLMDILWGNLEPHTKIWETMRRGRCWLLDDELAFREPHVVVRGTPLREVLASKGWPSRRKSKTATIRMAA